MHSCTVYHYRFQITIDKSLDNSYLVNLKIDIRHCLFKFKLQIASCLYHLKSKTTAFQALVLCVLSKH